jgi:sugar O-acyltransferase (sialic acid O-acetyltransferase NeuD family)
MRLLIVGARQHAKIIVSLVKNFNKNITIIGFLDDNLLKGSAVLNFPILGKIMDLSKVVQKFKINSIQLGLSSNHLDLRSKLIRKIKNLNLKIPNLIHPNAFISHESKIGKGNIINPGVVINSFSKVGNNCVIYCGAIIDHEVIIQDNVYIGSNVSIPSGVIIKNDTFIGAGTSFVNNVIIRERTYIGSGSNVTKSNIGNEFLIGNPAKFYKKR